MASHGCDAYHGPCHDPRFGGPLNLDKLDSESLPNFVIKISTGEVPFRIRFSNSAFCDNKLCNRILLENDRSATLFRGWAQAIDQFDDFYTFGGITWRAEVVRNWKVIRAVEFLGEPSLEHSGGPFLNKRQDFSETTDNDNGFHARTVSSIANSTNYPSGTASTLVTSPTSELLDPPEAAGQSYGAAIVRLQSLQRLMEMSDVGVFEYRPNGTLIHANEAWYRYR
jgi:hypothetical protein